MKSDIGRIAKKILDKVNFDVKLKTSLTQWKNSFEVIDWFNRIENKKKLCFLKFDIDKFYPSISKNELIGALKFAETYTNITPQDINIILHSCMSALSDSKGVEWVKKNDTNNFDVPMGSYMGAEICDLLGLYILSDLSSIDILVSFGLYQDKRF